MTGTQQRLLFLGDDAVAAAVAAVVDDASVATAERDAAPSATLDGDYDGVLVEDGSAEAIDAVRGITADEDAPDALLVTADCGGVDAAMDAGAVDYVRVNDPPRVLRRRVRGLTEARDDRERELDRYRTLVEAVGDPMYVLDEDGIVTVANEAMADHLGYDREAVVGSHTREFVADEDYERGTELLRELHGDDGRDWATYDMDSVTADGDRIPTENHVAVLEGESGEFAGSVGVVRDISERKRRTEALERQNERLDEFASVVGHDLRNPLNIVAGHLELARETGEARHFDAIEEEVGRIEDLLDELLTLARQGKVVSDPETVSLTAVARAAWEGVATGDATLELSDGDAAVGADETRLRELFENLFRNAVEHAGTGVTVRVGTTEEGFYVADDGPGIPEPDRDRVFDRGYTTAEEGTGLGLDIVERIAEGHGWNVSVAARDAGDRDERGRLLRGPGGGSDPESGARFEFRTGVSHR